MVPIPPLTGLSIYRTSLDIVPADRVWVSQRTVGLYLMTII